MFKFFKILLFSGVGIGAVLFFASIGVNLYLQSEKVQQRISLTVSHAMGGREVSIQNIFYTPWSGLVLSQVALTNNGSGNIPPLLEVAKIRLRIPLIPLLLQGKIRFSSLRIEEPTVTLIQNSEGHLALPLPQQQQLQQYQTSTAIPRTSSVLPPYAEDPNAVSQNKHPPSNHPQYPSVKPLPLPAKSVAEVLRKIVVSGGKLHLLSQKREPLVTAEGISIKLTPKEGKEEHFTGPLTCSRIILGKKLFFHNLRTLLSCNANSLEAHSLVASLANGKILGEFRCQFGSRQAFELKAKVADASLQSLLREAGYSTGGSSGILHGDVWVFSQGDKLEPYGNGSLELVHGQLEPTDFLRQLGHILQIQELELLRLKKAVTSFQIKDDGIVFEDIFLESENLILKGAGPVKFNGRLDIAAQLLFNDRLYSQYQSLIGKQLLPSSIEGYHEVAFRVSGKTSRPQADLLDKLTGVQFRGSIGNILQQFIKWPSSSGGNNTAPPPPATSSKSH